MRLIDADELIKATQHAGFIRRSEIEAATTVDAEPVRHGQWVSECEPHYECSVCHHWFHLYDRTNYCPNCGAKMDGDGDAR